MPFNALHDTITIQTGRKSLDTAIEWTAGFLGRTTLPESDRELFLLAVVEALNNAVEHGNTYKPETKVSIVAHADDRHVLVSITDEGDGIPSLTARKNHTVPHRGFGMQLIHDNCDMVIYNSGCNQIVLMKGAVEHMNPKLAKGQAATVKLGPETVLFNRIIPENINNTYELLSELFEFCEAEHFSSIMLDMAEVRLLTSLAWGRIFAEAEKEQVKSLVLFNTNEAMRTVARQMGIDEKGGLYKKIHILADADISSHI